MMDMAVSARRGEASLCDREGTGKCLEKHIDEKVLQ
jgi:hypothetical protein